MRRADAAWIGRRQKKAVASQKTGKWHGENGTAIRGKKRERRNSEREEELSELRCGNLPTRNEGKTRYRAAQYQAN
ncbi:hypothetical protein NDU88_003896 [Pleurodeles waltl]|uniref:Uncharacterized protein n=1 Tax=Pleurodeles waltl TaxID=8319 RepID=A0AAV7RE78_PLEWA|nr:hypothetical protein NDU88_003896 [Pleurodeles waltl]